MTPVNILYCQREMDKISKAEEEVITLKKENTQLQEDFEVNKEVDIRIEYTVFSFVEISLE